MRRKFPEFFKTHPTFVCSPLLMPSMAYQTLITLFLGHPVVQINVCQVKLAYTVHFRGYLPVPHEKVFPKLHEDLPPCRLVAIDAGHQPHLHTMWSWHDPTPRPHHGLEQPPLCPHRLGDSEADQRLAPGRAADDEGAGDRGVSSAQRHNLRELKEWFHYKYFAKMYLILLSLMNPYIIDR